MVSNLLDEYVLNVLKNSGWSDGRKQDITQWIQILTEPPKSTDAKVPKICQ